MNGKYDPKYPRDNVCRVWGSPLEGETLPNGWANMGLEEKKTVLIARHWASDYTDACSILGRHGGAVAQMRARKKKMREERSRRA